jgi:hypothetical protein
MKREDIIRMARKAGLIVDANQSGFDSVETFATLVRADEREACAKVCDEWYEKRGLYGVDVLARVIRARGNT